MDVTRGVSNAVSVCRYSADWIWSSKLLCLVVVIKQYNMYSLTIIVIYFDPFATARNLSMRLLCLIWFRDTKCSWFWNGMEKGVYNWRSLKATSFNCTVSAVNMGYGLASTSTKPIKLPYSQWLQLCKKGNFSHPTDTFMVAWKMKLLTQTTHTHPLNTQAHCVMPRNDYVNSIEMWKMLKREICIKRNIMQWKQTINKI